MKHWKLHLWFLINVLVIAYFWFNQTWAKSMPIFVFMIFFLSGFLLKTKKKIREEYTKDIGLPGILFAVGFVAVMIYGALSAVNNPNATPSLSTAQVQYGLIGLLIFFLGFYIYTLHKRISTEDGKKQEEIEIPDE